MAKTVGNSRTPRALLGRVAFTLAGLALAVGCRGAGRPDETEESLGATSLALTQTVTYQRGVRGTVADTSLSSAELKKSFGSAPNLRLSAENEALLEFDLSAIPPSAVVGTATLKVYLNGGEDEADDDGDDGDKHGFPVVPINVHRATAPWAESTATYATFGQHFDSTVVGILLPTSSNVFKSVDVKSLVQAWVSGAQPNDGLLLRTAAKKHTLIVSSEGQSVALRPSLSVTYTTPDDHCAPNPCRNGGSCANGAQGYTCTCPAGYTGASCETSIDRCASHPCQNGGACSSSVSSYTCACADGFSGANCQTNVNDCAPNPCQNGGICTDGTNSHTCACPTGYMGTNCQTLIDSCAASPCRNAGVCTNGVGTYSCGCAAGFTGVNCEINIDDCAAQPCLNGGSCSDGIASFTCSCAPGFSGTTCQTLVDNCAAGPCQNGGVCTN